MWKLLTVVFFSTVLSTRATEEDSSYGKPEGRCIGSFVHEKAKPKPGAEVIMRFEPHYNSEASCFLACRLHTECWAFQMDNSVWRVACVLYGKGSVELNPNGNLTYVWRCQKNIPECIFPNNDRCPGQWVREFSLSVIREALEAIQKEENPNNQPKHVHLEPHPHSYEEGVSHGRFICDQPVKYNISLKQCKEDCWKNKYCNTFKYQPSATLTSGSFHPSICLLVDSNDLFPRSEGPRIFSSATKNKKSTAQLITQLISELPDDWIQRTVPTKFRWTCCPQWWEKIDYSDETQRQLRTSCRIDLAHSVHLLEFQPDEPSSVATFLQQCFSGGYWSLEAGKFTPDLKVHNVSELIQMIKRTFTRHAFPNGSFEFVKVIGLFYTQNPLHCVAECFENPCCLGPIYDIHRWRCILLGAFEVPTVCTAKNLVEQDGEYEWGEVMELQQLNLIQTPLIIWKIHCCLSSVSATRRGYLAYDGLAKETRDFKKPFHPNRLTTCVCEGSKIQQVLMANSDELRCIAKQSYENWISQEPRKFATAPIAFFVNRREELAIFNEEKLEMVSFEDPRWDEGLFENLDRIWIPVFSNLFLDSKQWAGPASRLASCSLLRCRVQVDNNLTTVDQTEVIPTNWDPTEPWLKVLPHEQWLEPSCTRRSSFKPFGTDITIKKIVVHDLQGTKFRCFTPHVCTHYLRQVALEQMKESMSGIGFNYMIGNDGTVFEGRGMNYEGRHTHGHNLNSYGIAFIGWYPVNPMPIAPLKSFWYLVKYLQYYGKVSKDFVVYTHQDLQPSECPGTALQVLINSWSGTTTGGLYGELHKCSSEPEDDPSSSSKLLIRSLCVLSALVIVAAGFLVGRVLMDFQLSRLLQTGGTSSRIEHTFECQQWSEVCRRVIRDQQEFRQTEVHPVLCLGRYDSFLRAYIRPAEVKLRLALQNNLESQGYGVEIALITLFCHSWKSVLERTLVLPPLILWSLSALRRYFISDGVRTPFRIQLLTNNTDFMIMVCSSDELQYEALMTELCSDTSQITNLYSPKSFSNPFCCPKINLSCLKCDLCRQLDDQENCASSESRKRPGIKRLKSNSKQAYRKKNTHITNPHEWVLFVKCQRDYATIPDPVLGRYSNFQEFLVYEESRLDRMSPAT
ncbi:hypothetical protein D915_006630 [Fasciola hepatica]|uniref:Peptidoglycan recognition protein family domain-containing protein n=1 Tax=Fasciola hepatica TaxID=6192 RepID=A0A4E0RP37_FASHE|nr:hypothetical protein D915_006630 [Fasciola hepatica]